MNKKFKIIITLFFFLLNTNLLFSNDNITADIKHYLNYTIGQSFYSIDIEKHEKKHYWIEIYPSYSTTLWGKITPYDLPSDIAVNIEEKLNSKYGSLKFTVKQMPVIPRLRLNELQRRETMKRLLLAGLIGIVSLFVIFIAIRTRQLRREEFLLEKKLKENQIDFYEWLSGYIDMHGPENKMVFKISNANFLEIVKQYNINTVFEEKSFFKLYTYYLSVGSITLSSAFRQKLIDNTTVSFKVERL